MWAWPPFSLAPLVTTFYPNVTLTQCIYAFRRLHDRRADSRGDPVAAAALPARACQPRAGQQPAPAGHAAVRWRAILRDRRIVWRAPRTETPQRPSLTIARTIGLLILRGYIIFLRGYIIFAIVIVALKLVQVATAY